MVEQFHPQCGLFWDMKRRIPIVDDELNRTNNLTVELRPRPRTLGRGLLV